MNPTISFIDHGGELTKVEANIGDSLMQTAVQNDVAGIDADCGGACACATCHVYVHEDWVAKVGEFGELEEEMLDVVEERLQNSRLSCQIAITANLDGLVVTTPESQF